MFRFEQRGIERFFLKEEAASLTTEEIHDVQSTPNKLLEEKQRSMDMKIKSSPSR